MAAAAAAALGELQIGSSRDRTIGAGLADTTGTTTARGRSSADTSPQRLSLKSGQRTSGSNARSSVGAGGRRSGADRAGGDITVVDVQIRGTTATSRKPGSSGGRSEPRSSVGARLSTVSTSVSSDSGRVVGGRASAQSQSQGPSPGRPSTRGGSRASADRAAAAARLAAGTSARPSTRAGRGSRALPPIAGRPSRGSEEASGSGGARTSAGSAVSRRSHGYMPKQKQTFYLGGGNGVKLLQGLLEAKGFERIPSGPAGRASSQFKIKWCERASDFNFAEFKEGKQLIGRNPKIACIGNKLKLRQTMVAYERSCTQKGVPCLKTASFLPMTYELTNARERQSFEQLSAENPAWQWICKPTGLNCGQGIFVVDDVAEFKQKLARDDAERQPGAKVPTRIIQRYIANPMLLKGRKFDIRAYMLIASAKPLLGLYGGRGYCRLTIDEYDGAAAGNKAAHLTNQAVQKKHPRYKEMVEDTTWSIEMMNDYLNEHGKAPKDWALNVLPEKIKAIMTQVLKSIEGKIDPRMGIFDFLGLDFLIDEELNVWFIETNVNPALHRNSTVLDERITKAVTTALDIVLEVHEKQRAKEPLLPFVADTGEWEVLVGP